MTPSKRPPAPAKKFPKTTPEADQGQPASALIDARVSELADWRGALLSELRAVIRAADPGVHEEWKWNVPVWSCNGIICTGETYAKAVKLTFAKGAFLADPHRLFNASLTGKLRRAIDIAQEATIDKAALSALIREAVRINKAPMAPP
jgi:hypothetical protein